MKKIFLVFSLLASLVLVPISPAFADVGINYGFNKNVILGSGENMIYGAINNTSNAGSRLIKLQSPQGTDRFTVTKDGEVRAYSICDENGANCHDISAGWSSDDLWTLSGSNIYRSTGNVGIGTTNPLYRLQVNGNIGTNYNSIVLNPSGGSVATDGTYGIYWHQGAGVPDGGYGIYRSPGSWIASTYQQLRIAFATGIQLSPGVGVGTGYDKSYVEVITGKGLMVTSGNVGIGTTNPLDKLYIAGTNISGSDVLNNDEADRPGVSVKGSYPEINLISTMNVSNLYHGPTLRFVGYKDANKNSWNHWVIGTSGIADNLDFGFSSASQSNPHYGIANYDKDWGGTSGYTFMRITSAGNVGIGTTNPAKKFHVVGDSHMVSFENTNTVANNYAGLEIKAGTAASYLWTANQNSTSWGGANSLNIYTAAGNMTFWTNATEKVRILTNGNVGIGTTGPGYKLDVSGTGRFTGILTVATPVLYTAITGVVTAPISVPEVNTGSGGFVPLIHGRTLITGGYRKHVSIGSYRTGSLWNGGIYFGQGGNDNYPTEYFLMDMGGALTHSSGKITTTGNVGIGTTNPVNGKLEVIGGSAAIYGDGTNYGVYGKGYASAVYGHGGNNGVYGYGHITGVLGASDNIGVKASGDNYDFYAASGNPSYFAGSLHVLGFNSIFGTGNVADNVGNIDARVFTSTYLKQSPGAVCSNSYGSLVPCSSDVRLKTNIRTMDNALEKVSNLRGVYFDWQKDGEKEFSQGPDAGIIAQELEKVLPEAVGQDYEGYKTIKNDVAISGLLIEAIKELKKQNDDLRQRIENLENR